MLSKPLAIVLIVGACLVAAAGGAYVATLQHARSVQQQVAAQPTQPVQAPVNTQVPVAAAPAPATQAVATAEPASPVAAPSGSAAPAQAQPPAVAAPPAELIPPVSGTTRPAASTPKAAKAGARQNAKASAPAVAERRATEPLPAPDPQNAEPSQRSAAAALPPVTSIPPVAAPPDAPAREAAPPAPVWEELTVPAESVLGIQLDTPLSSETAHVEDRVEGRVSRDVRVNGRVAIPYGTRVIGSVILVERGGKIKDRARIGIRFNTLVLADASRLAISTETITREGEPPSDKSSAKIGGGAIGGAIIGAILGGGKGAAIGSGIGAAGGTAAVMAGDRQAAVLRAGTPLTARILSPLTVTVEK